MPRWGFLLLTAMLLLPAEPLCAGALDSLEHLIGPDDAVAVADSQGRVVFSRHAGVPRVPASTLKLLTALTALHHLGPAYRFPTEFYRDPSGDLTVMGYGDPLLLSEILDRIGASLRERITTVRDVRMDDSYFSDPLTIPGVSASAEPYDAPNGALCANFNTVAFKREKGRLISDEPQTPLLEFARNRIRKTGLAQGRITLSHQRRETTLYAGWLLRHFLDKNGIAVTGTVRWCAPCQTAGNPLLYTHLSPFGLPEVIEKMMAYSNNFTANQLLIAAGAKAFGPPGNLEKGVRAARSYAAEQLGLSHLDIEEGSGISRANRVTAAQMLAVLEAFEPYRDLLRVTGRDRFKTGSLNGIRCRAGYITGASGEWYRYVVLINTPGKTTDAVMRVLLEGL